jgi:putative addiction module component (TIGR02574 family)
MKINSAVSFNGLHCIKKIPSRYNSPLFSAILSLNRGGHIMTQVNRNIVEDALSLSMNERAELVEKLLESLDTPNAELNTIWAQESDARIEAYDNNQLNSKPLSKVLSKYK